MVPEKQRSLMDIAAEVMADESRPIVAKRQQKIEVKPAA